MSDFLLAQLARVSYMCCMMNLACAEPDKGWGQWPCEGLVPSSRSCVSGGTAAARRARPGPGAACKGSNVADRILRSYGGQRFCWSEMKEIKNARKKCSSSAAASQTTNLAAVSLDFRRNCLSGPGPVDVLVGVNGDPFIALGSKHG